MVMMEHAVHKVKKVHQEILSGEIGIHPYRKDRRQAVITAATRNICGFDTRIDGYDYRQLRKMSLEEAIAAMKGERQAWESSGPKNNRK